MAGSSPQTVVIAQGLVILGIAIITGFPQHAARALVGRAANIVEDGRADALVGFAAFGAIRTRQTFPVGWAVRRRCCKVGALDLDIAVLLGCRMLMWH